MCTLQLYANDHAGVLSRAQDQSHIAKYAVWQIPDIHNAMHSCMSCIFVSVTLLIVQARLGVSDINRKERAYPLLGVHTKSKL